MVGCSEDRNANNANAQPPTPETVLNEGNSAFPGTRKLEISGAEEIFTEAINNATQMAGIVNMAAPDYRFSIGGETYYLWVSDDSGISSIMNTKDTHTLYSLTRISAREINDFINNNR